MIRTRDVFEDNHPTTPSPSPLTDTKRLRTTPTPLPPPHSDMDLTQHGCEDILHRCLTFLHHTQDQSRPKTLERLHHAVEQISTFDYAIDPHVIYFHLVLNQILIPYSDDTSGVNFVSVNTTPPTRTSNQWVVVIPTHSASNRVSDDFKEVLKKSATWVQNNRGLRGKQVQVDSFVRSLTQICVVKKTAQPGVVVEMMVKRGWVVVLEDGVSVVYRLDGDEQRMEQQQQQSHYMPVLCK